MYTIKAQEPHLHEHLMALAIYSLGLYISIILFTDWGGGAVDGVIGPVCRVIKLISGVLSCNT